MKELSKKVFFTIFGILSLFLIISLLLLNIQNYRREYNSIKRNLTIMEEPWKIIPGGDSQGRRDDIPLGGSAPFDVEPKKDIELNSESTKENNTENESDIENMRIIDYEVYTAELADGQIMHIFSHGNESADFDPESVVEEIISNYNTDTLIIRNLYLNGYSFYYSKDRITIVNDTVVAEKMRKLLLETIIIFIFLELLIIFISKIITGWIIKPAKEAFEKQKEFIADASHELKTPLAVIMASADEMYSKGAELSEGTEGTSVNSKYIENIRYESDRMNKLISGLLDLSKLEEGISKETYKEENLSRIVEKNSLVFEGIAFEEGVQIESDIEDDIIFSCSKEEMEKLISTLIDNGIKHSKKDTILNIKLYRNKGDILLEITNTGDPIPEGDEDRIFERFYRGDKSRDRSENRYGLGLAIAKSIVVNHGGTIEAFSKDGRTTFKIKF